MPDGAGQPHRAHGHECLASQILQEVITLAVFIPFAVLYLKEPIRLNFVLAGPCMVAAVWFMFRK